MISAKLRVSEFFLKKQKNTTVILTEAERTGV